MSNQYKITKHTHLSSIQGLRGIAAMSVVLMHFVGMIAYEVNTQSWASAKFVLSMYGHAGVDIFFVLSGALMVIITLRQNSIEHPVIATIKFIINRAFRIYPVFIITFFAMSYIRIKYDGQENINLNDYIGYLTLYLKPDLYHPAAWTMPYEIRLYFVVSLILLFSSSKLYQGFIAAAVAHVAIVSAGNLGIESIRQIQQGIISELVGLEFILGGVVAYLLLKKPPIKPIFFIVIGVFGILIGGYWNSNGDLFTYRFFFFGIPSACILYGFIGRELEGKAITHKFIQWLGDISYSIYLWHLPVFYSVVFFMIERKINIFHYPFLSLLFFLSISTLVSWISFRFVEVPFLTFARKLNRHILSKEEYHKKYKQENL